MPTITVPTTPEELVAILSDDAKRKEIFADAESSKEFLAAYNKAVNKGDALSKQISEQVQAGLVDFFKDQGVETTLDSTAVSEALRPGLGTGAIKNAMHNPKAAAAKLDGLYDSIAEVALDVHKYRQGHQLSNPDAFAKVQEITNEYSSKDPSTGGFLIPEEMRSNIMMLALEQSVVRQRATVITMGSLQTSIPFVDQTTHVGSVFGGMVFYWVGEGQTITKTQAKFGRVKLEASKLVGGAGVPNELWADAPAFSSWLDAAAPMGIVFYEDLAFLSGNGVGQPLGVLNGSGLVTVDRVTTDELEPLDIYNMYARMLPQSLSNAVWVVNQTLLPKLFGMQTVVTEGGANVGGGFPLGVVNIANSPVPTILGRPMIVTEKVPALANGAGKDISFVDFRYYLLGDRQAISVDYSEHSKFMEDETELRIIERVDGRPWVKSALQPVNGDPVSPYVTLSDA